MERLWSLKKVTVIPIVLGALGSVTKNFEKYTEKLEVVINVTETQKTTLLGTARILRMVLEYGVGERI